MRKLFILVPILSFVGCAGKFACKEELIKSPPGFKSQVMMVSCGAGGDTRPGMTSERGFIFQRDSEGNELVTPMDTGFASEGSTKNKGLEIINTGVQGGLQAVTAGQFKPNKHNSTTNLSNAGGNQNQSNDQSQSQQQEQAQKQHQEAKAQAAAQAAANANANASVISPVEKPKPPEPRHYRPSPQPEYKRPPINRGDLNSTQNIKIY